MHHIIQRNAELDAVRTDLVCLRGELASARRLIARKFDEDQPRVPAGNPDGGQWTNGSGDGEGMRLDQVFLDPRRAVIQRGMEAALSLFSGLSASNGEGGQAFIAFNAREFRVGDDHDMPMAAVARLTRDEVDAYCPRFADVQQRTDETYARIAQERPFASASQLGTAVHVSLREQIDKLGDPDYHAEVSRLKSQEAGYGVRGSIRIDALEGVRPETVCVYDIKTGRSGLTPARMFEIAASASRIFPGTRRLVVTEIRPRR